MRYGVLRLFTDTIILIYKTIQLCLFYSRSMRLLKQYLCEREEFIVLNA
jgi:hypothetical protein